MGLRRERIAKAEAETFLNSAQSLPIRLEDPEPYGALFQLADRHGLTIYDAAFLDMATRKGLPLATLDTALVRAAGRCNSPALGQTAKTLSKQPSSLQTR
jgi:predicted nucleic acid-binding protein